MSRRSFEIKMDCDNSAFDDDPVAEIRRALLAVISQLDQADRHRVKAAVFRYAGYVRDTNGNAVGHWSFSSEQDKPND